MKIEKYLNKNKTEFSNKIIVITGTTSGIGFEVFKLLAQTESTLVLGVRNTALASAQKEDILKKFPNAKIEVLPLDLSNTSSILNFSEQVIKKFPTGIDCLINNAGIFARPKKILPVGFEEHFFVNTIAPIILSKKLIPLLEKKRDSKLVFVSSISMKNSKINKDDIDLKNEKKSIKTYANTKCWLSLFASVLKQNLEKQNSNVCVNLVHPGITASSLLSNKNGRLSKGVYAFVNFGMKLIFHSTKKAACSEIVAVTKSSTLKQWFAPWCFGVWGMPSKQKIPFSSKQLKFADFCFKTLDSITNNMLNCKNIEN
ncbi:MAG: SDR family NAD(P)-dependent oxidoreductase [Clostridia bacterium]|nr:SDR family NAD(P)-dependent oxidoreductase [Clostridia bacterium]